MPTWFNESLLVRLKSLQDYTMGLMYATQEQRRITGGLHQTLGAFLYDFLCMTTYDSGLWAKTVIDNMMKKANGSLDLSKKKVFSYSAVSCSEI